MKSFLGGLQAFCGGAFDCTVEAPRGGKYTLSLRVVHVHDEEPLSLTVNDAGSPVVAVIPFTCGQWEQTAPATITLVRGKNTLRFAKPARGFTFKEITLSPVHY